MIDITKVHGASVKLANEVQKQYERLVVREARRDGNTPHTSTLRPHSQCLPNQAHRQLRNDQGESKGRCSPLAAASNTTKHEQSMVREPVSKGRAKARKAQRRHERFSMSSSCSREKHAQATPGSQPSYAAVMQAEQEADKALQHLEKCMERAADLKARSDEHRNNEASSESGGEGQTLQQNIGEIEGARSGVANLHKRFGREDVVMRQLQRKRELELELIRERNRLLTASREEVSTWEKRPGSEHSRRSRSGTKQHGARE